MQEISIKIHADHIEWLETQALMVGLPVETLVNNLITISQKTLPQIAILAAAAMEELTHKRKEVSP